MGRYSREKQYSDLLEEKLSKNEVQYKREFPVQNTGNIVDFYIENKIILELKAKKIITKKDYYQVQRYLQSINIKLGLLVNLRNRHLKPIRVLRIETDSRHKFLQ